MYLRNRAGTVRCQPTRTTSTSRPVRPRAYAVARQFKPLLVNTVVGFIGPGICTTAKQIIRAGLETTLRQTAGFTMGATCATQLPPRTDQNDMDVLLLGGGRLYRCDGHSWLGRYHVELPDQSFHDALYARRALGFTRAALLKPEAWRCRSRRNRTSPTHQQAASDL
jgi:ethanolamine ammonia-lyase large subunit